MRRAAGWRIFQLIGVSASRSKPRELPLHCSLFKFGELGVTPRLLPRIACSAFGGVIHVVTGHDSMHSITRML
jgi:hypothetical protein